MFISDYVPEINNVELDVFAVHYAERYYNELLPEGYREYSELDYLLIDKLTDFIQLVIEEHFFEEYRFVSRSEEETRPIEGNNENYFKNQVNFYESTKSERIKNKRFPEYNFFMTFDFGFTYPHPSRESYEISRDYDTDSQTPYYDVDLFALFFAFKLRNMSPYYIGSFLDYQEQIFKNCGESIECFLGIITTQYKGLILEANLEGILLWLKNENNCRNEYKTVENVEDDKIKVQTDKEINAELSIKTQSDFSLKKISKRKKKIDISFYALFKKDRKRMDTIIDLLKSKDVNAIDDKNTWVYSSTLNTLVSCFNALEDLEYIKSGVPRTELQRCVKTKIFFEASEKLFSNPDNKDAYKYFHKLFLNIKTD